MKTLPLYPQADGTYEVVISEKNMTTSIKVVNDGHYPVVVNVVECERIRDEGQTIERHDLKPGETSPSITIYGWRRYINVLESAPSEDGDSVMKTYDPTVPYVDRHQR